MMIILFLCVFFVFSPIFVSDTNDVYKFYVNDDYHGNISGWGVDHFATIQDAIDNAIGGDTIFVYDGTYYENIEVNKTIILIGEGINTTIIDGVDIYGYVVEINNVNFVNISGFTIRGEYGGVHINNSDHNVLSYNMIIGCGGNPLIDIPQEISGLAGIELRLSNNNTIFENIIKCKSNYNLLLIGSNKNTIYGNIIVGSHYGISLIAESTNPFDILNATSSNNNMIYGNNITNNEIGLHLSISSLNNFIYLNNIINNTKNANDEGINTSWDFEGRGNYWSDYYGSDTNKDGIGNIPYYVPGGNNQDNYPLTIPYKETNVKVMIDPETVYFKLFIGVVISILFVLPISYIWYRKRTK